MDNYEYNRLIMNNKLNELSEIWNLSDLTRYKFRGKYLLEHLLEKNIHNTRMDNYASRYNKWIILYLKYNIIKPVLNTPLDKLLVLYNNEFLLETILKKSTKNERIKLYQNLMTNSYWQLHDNETLIINLFNKYGITIPKTFIKMPLIADKDIKVNGKLQNILIEFANTFSDIEENILQIYINEFKRKAKINSIRTYHDIEKIIYYKKNNPSFTLTIKEYELDEDILSGEYNSYKKRIVIGKSLHGIFNHELSHLLYDKFENPLDIINNSYRNIQKNIRRKETIYKIIEYLKDFHKRYNNMKEIFKELYYANIKVEYGSFNNYCENVESSLLRSNPAYITLDRMDTTIFLTEDNIKQVVSELIINECNEYVNILTKNYYAEELMLENLLDALLKGDIFDHKYDVECLSGHSKLSFETEKTLSFDEVLADYDTIKNSSKANILINKLRTLVGNRLVDYLDNYIEEYRNSKDILDKRIESTFTDENELIKVKKK